MAARVLDLKAHHNAEVFTAPRVGSIASIDLDELYVDFPGSRGPVRARLALRVDRERLEQARRCGQPVLLLFEDGDPDKPILTSLIEPMPSPVTVDELASAAQPLHIEVDADGRRACVRAQNEITFACGKASVTLMNSGRVIIRGTYIETCATGTNQIKGGRVRIN